jgi:hypothetical protein
MQQGARHGNGEMIYRARFFSPGPAGRSPEKRLRRHAPGAGRVKCFAPAKALLIFMMEKDTLPEETISRGETP